MRLYDWAIRPRTLNGPLYIFRTRRKDFLVEQQKRRCRSGLHYVDALLFAYRWVRIVG